MFNLILLEAFCLGYSFMKLVCWLFPFHCLPPSCPLLDPYSTFLPSAQGGHLSRWPHSGWLTWWPVQGLAGELKAGGGRLECFFPPPLALVSVTGPSCPAAQFTSTAPTLRTGEDYILPFSFSSPLLQTPGCTHFMLVLCTLPTPWSSPFQPSGVNTCFLLHSDRYVDNHSPRSALENALIWTQEALVYGLANLGHSLHLVFPSVKKGW